MSAPHSSTKRQRLSTKLHTPGSVFGIRNKNGNEVEPGNYSQFQHTIRPERLTFNINNSVPEDYEGLEGTYN
jgi:hypothetical protein